MHALWQIELDGRRRLAVGTSDQPEALLAEDLTLDAVVTGGADALGEVLEGPTTGSVPAGSRVLPPLGTQEVWAAGVTYRRSRDARMDESDAPDHYDRVYEADRPELFFKANPQRVRGHADRIGIRADSSWNVPESELALVADPGGQILGYTVGNDVSSRDIEGANPLYLPQAKSYDGSCALGPCLVPAVAVGDVADLEIRLAITRDAEVLYTDAVSVETMHRTCAELVDWLFRATTFPVGVALLTGTALIPPPEFSLQADDEVAITIPGIGTLANTVEVVGRPA